MVDWEAEARRGCCARMWRGKWNLRPRGPRWLPEIVRMTWFLLVINLVMGIQGGVDGDLVVLTELCRGGTLKHVLQEATQTIQMDADTRVVVSAAVAYAVVQALAHMHTRGYAHMDTGRFEIEFFKYQLTSRKGK